MKSVLIVIAAALAMTACTSLPEPVTVLSSAETDSQPRRDGGTGSPAIWIGWMRRGEASPINVTFTASTSRAGGLILTGLDGEVVQRIEGQRLGDIDVASLPSANGYTVLVGAARQAGRSAGLVFYKRNFDRDTQLVYWGEVLTDQAQPRAFCMRQTDGMLNVVTVDQQGDARVLRISEGPDGAIQNQEVLRFQVEGMGQGCAIDPLRGHAYFSLARGGFLRASVIRPGALLRLTDTTWKRLPRSLGVSFLNVGADRYLTSLDEDRRAFSVWRVENETVNWLGRVEVRESANSRAVRNRGGVDAYGGSYGTFAEGVVVVQDQANDDSPNLKYVKWADVRLALGF